MIIEKQYRRLITLFSIVALFAFMGCATRSISNTGYPDRYGRGNTKFYSGELQEFHVLGIDPAKPVSEKDILATLDTKKELSLRKGDSVFVDSIWRLDPGS